MSLSPREKEVLTPRETEILTLAIQGHTVRQIAAKTGTSCHTVDTHRRRILDKLQATCMEHVILRAHRLGILNLDTVEDVFVTSKRD